MCDRRGSRRRVGTERRSSGGASRRHAVAADTLAGAARRRASGPRAAAADQRADAETRTPTKLDKAEERARYRSAGSSAGSWEGSCNELALDKLYKERGVPVGKYAEWKAAGAKVKKYDLEAEATLQNRAKKLGLTVEITRKVVTRYHLYLVKDSSGYEGTLAQISGHLDKIEAACAANKRKTTKTVWDEILNDGLEKIRASTRFHLSDDDLPPIRFPEQEPDEEATLAAELQPPADPTIEPAIPDLQRKRQRQSGPRVKHAHTQYVDQEQN